MKTRHVWITVALIIIAVLGMIAIADIQGRVLPFKIIRAVRNFMWKNDIITAEVSVSDSQRWAVCF